MDNVGYLIAGYGVTGAAIVAYRWELSRRSRRARRLITALSGRRAPGSRARR